MILGEGMLFENMKGEMLFEVNYINCEEVRVKFYVLLFFFFIRKKFNYGWLIGGWNVMLECVFYWYW